MTAIHETAYPRIKPNLSQKELSEIFKPTEDEIALLNQCTKKTTGASRLGFMITLKCYQYLGKPISLRKVGSAIMNFVASHLEIDNKIDLNLYKNTTRKRHIKIIREFLQINDSKIERRKILKSAALEAAATRENLADIINVMIEELIKSRFELPSFKRMLRIARAARTVANNKNYQQIANALSEKQKRVIDLICGITSGTDSDEIPLSWSMLKLEPKKPTLNNIKSYIQYVNSMLNLRKTVCVPIDFISPFRLEQLRDEATATDISDMKRLRPLKRYALAVIFISMKAGAAIDDLVQVFITWIRNIESNAKHQLEEYRIEHADKTDEHVLLLYNILNALKNERADVDKVRSIEAQIGGNLDEILEQCREYLGLTGENHIKWIIKPYQNKRTVIFQLLDAINIFSSTNDKAIENALRFIMQYRHSNQEWIDVRNPALSVKPELSLLSDNWFKAVTGLNYGKEVTVTKINRLYYEIAIFIVLMVDLNCGDAFVEGALTYDDPNKQYINWEQFYKTVDKYCEVVQLEKEPAKCVLLLQDKMRKATKQVDDNYYENPYLVINDGMPILKKLPKKAEPEDLETIRQMIAEKMPFTSIVDAIVDVENWLNLSINFKPHSGYEVKIKDYPPRFVATSLAYGCNLGPTQTERCIQQKYSRKQIAWIFNHHATENKLVIAIKKIIYGYNEFALPRYWGPGDSMSADGTFWDMYKQNLLAAHHIRYGRYGGVGYYHVSDRYIALFSNFISCGAHESVFLLDDIVKNDLEIEANKIHGDSWAQSEVLFGLSMLLGILVMPRIKQFKHLNYYKASTKDHYANIDELFTEKAIDWELIEKHYFDMLRIAMSIQQGKIKASTVLRRLCSKSRKNKLYFAFRELGRVERTIFLLNYINDAELRRTIHAATCKSEEFNEYIGWINFGDGGVISDNMRANQRKIIKFNHLMANILIFYTVVHQTKAINQLRENGIAISNEILSHLAPYWTEHYNRYGMFNLDMQKTSTRIEYELAA